MKQFKERGSRKLILTHSEGMKQFIQYLCKSTKHFKLHMKVYR